MKAICVGIVCDLREENWPSMDLVADMLLEHLQRDHSSLIEATRICPPMRRRFSDQSPEARDRRSEIGTQGSDFSAKLFNVDRVLNRYLDYPKFIRRLRSQFDLFHLVDHSYAQLVHELPPERTIVTCHDLDTFKCLLNPAEEPRSIFFKKMMRRTLNGFRQAARVACDSIATRDELLAHELFSPDRVVVIPNGVHPSCSPDADRAADESLVELLGPEDPDAPEILHVGSTIRRKRIDLLLRIFAAVLEEFPRARLIRVGGALTGAQAKLAYELGIASAITTLTDVERNQLASAYRRAAVVLQPSDREGFGLPVVEGLACGSAVVASDIPVLREVGGDAALYCAIGDIPSWKKTVSQLVSENRERSMNWRERRDASIGHASKFSWAAYTERVVALYQELG